MINPADGSELQNPPTLHLQDIVINVPFFFFFFFFGLALERFHKYLKSALERVLIIDSTRQLGLHSTSLSKFVGFLEQVVQCFLASILMAPNSTLMMCFNQKVSLYIGSLFCLTKLRRTSSYNPNHI